MDFLIRAEKYAEARGDEMFFKHYYTLNRVNFSVRDSVRYTLEYMYDDHVADLLEYQ